MRVAVIGASGKTGVNVVRAAVNRGDEVVGVCRESSVHRLAESRGHDRLTTQAAAVAASVVGELPGATGSLPASLWLEKRT